jgi:hypothetical protein
MSWNDKWNPARNTNTMELLDHPRIINRENLPGDSRGYRDQHHFGAEARGWIQA